MGYNTNCKVVNGCALVFTHQHFWSDVTRMARGVARVVLLPQSGKTKVNDLDEAITFEHDVVWSDISMDDAVVVDELKSQDYACDNKLSLLLIEG
jgi:hypothetical protein